MLQFIEYRKQYNGLEVVSAPALELEHNLYWLKGENGSGKTTLIKSIAGLIPFDGDIFLGGVNIKQNRNAYRLLVSYAEAEPIYPVFLTGDDLIRFYAETRKANKQQVDGLVSSLGIAGFSGRKIGTYSSGMVKKLSLVLAFIGSPKLVLLDEPLITLDHEAVGNLQELIGNYFSDGVSFLVTSHQEITFKEHEAGRLAIADRRLVRVA